MLFHHVHEDAVAVVVRKGFEGMGRVLTGRPQPASIELRLFYENERERACNEEFVRQMRARYARVRHVPFTLAEARRAFWHREEGRDVSPDADVMIVALDEPWVRIFSLMRGPGGPLLASWDPAAADPAQRALVAELTPRLRRYAVQSRNDNGAGGSGAGDNPLQPMLAIPHYFDLGLLLRRLDLTRDLEPPTHWDAVGDSAQDRHSFETIVGGRARQLGVPAFSFNTDSAETTACVVLEMCWNFMADQDFLRERRQHNVDAATRALQFLARLRWAGLLPYPCKLKECARALYTRAWYANLPELLSLGTVGGATPEFQPVPFLTSAPQGDGGRTRQQLLRYVARRHKGLRQAHAALLRQWKGGGHHVDRVALHETLQECAEDLERIERRCAEIEAGAAGAIGGWSCSGAWYLGVVSTGGNANFGWSIVQEALGPSWVEKRAFGGAGLPPLRSFYRHFDGVEVPGLKGTSFGALEREFFGRTRARESALGIGIERPASGACGRRPRGCLPRNARVAARLGQDHPG